ncbi:MAG: release factor glutamine methyltransferase [Gammaproteobacteria bacterium]|jgi:release factor glutamine methyltransferase
MCTIRDLIAQGVAQLETATATAQATLGSSAALDAQLLLAHRLRKPRVFLFAHPEQPVTSAIAEHFRTDINRRHQGVPIAYIVGHREFWSLDLTVTAATLVPRPDTEWLVETALSRVKNLPAPDIADLGTGSGAIALAIGTEREDARIVASDVSACALAIAACNAVRMAQSQICFVRAHWLRSFTGSTFDCIVSNPPYIRLGDPHLTQGDVAHEPRLALEAGEDGLEAIREIVHSAPAHLGPNGWLCLEHGYDQAEAVRTLLQNRGFHDVTTTEDLAGQPRVSVGQIR